MPENEFIEINLELLATDAVMCANQPLLEVANRTIRKRYHRYGAFPQLGSQRLAASQVLETSFF